MNISPKLDELKQILENAVGVARSVGVQMPKVACLAAVETVNPAMEATLNAVCLDADESSGPNQKLRC